MKDYTSFINQKHIRFAPRGFSVDLRSCSHLFPFQRDATEWGLALGSALFGLERGLGKTRIGLTCAHYGNRQTNKPSIVACPLAVADGFIDEARAIGMGEDVTYARSQSEFDESGAVICITNYEMLRHFDMSKFGMIVLDESSILKNQTGKMRNWLIEACRHVPYKINLSATPSPNQHIELGNQSEYLGVMKMSEVKAEWFKQNRGKVQEFNLNAHSAADFWDWVASWAIFARAPSDLGDYSDDGYILPPVNYVDCMVAVDHRRAWNRVGKGGQMSLLLDASGGGRDLFAEKRETLSSRMKRTAEIVRGINDYCVVFVNTDAEADMMRDFLPRAVEMRGSEKLETKREKLRRFTRGQIQTFITKPKMVAFGLNWQHCCNVVEASVDHSFEKHYQAIGRFNRFGQSRPVNVFTVYAESEGDVVANRNRKAREHHRMQTEIIQRMKTSGMRLDGHKQVMIFQNHETPMEMPAWV